MMRNKRVAFATALVLLVLVAAVFAVAGCGSSTATTSSSAAGGGTDTTAAATTSSVTDAGSSTTAASKVVHIGITQIVTHPALDSTVQGFIDALKAAGYVEGTNVVYDRQNAQGDMANATTIAQKFVGDKADMIFSVATPTSQAAVKATTTIPVVFAAVTDPVAAGLDHGSESARLVKEISAIASPDIDAIIPIAKS